MKYTFDLDAIDAPAIKKEFAKYGVQGVIEFDSLYCEHVTFTDTVLAIFESAVKNTVQAKNVSCWEKLQHVPLLACMNKLDYSEYNYFTVHPADCTLLEAVPNQRLIHEAILYLEEKMCTDIRYITTNMKIYGARVMLCNAIENCLERLRLLSTRSIPWKVVVRYALPFMSETDTRVLVDAIHQHIKDLYAQDTTKVQRSEYVSDICGIPSDDLWDCYQDRNEERFKFYSILPDTEIAYITEGAGDKRELVARALLHEAWVYNGAHYEPIKIMDRIYSKEHKYEIMMLKYAKENGFYTKARQEGMVHTYVSPEGYKFLFKDMYIRCQPLQYRQFTEVPYMDTFNITAMGDDKIWTRKYGNSHLIEGQGIYKKIIHITPGESGYVPYLCK